MNAADLKQWQPREMPDLKPVHGNHIAVLPLDLESDTQELYESIGAPEHHHLWKFLPPDPFCEATAFADFLRERTQTESWIPFIFRRPSDGLALGTASYMRLRPQLGSAEVGCVIYSERLKQTPAATEAMYFMARHIFEDLGYRRYEWKCDNNNEASKKAATRLGFTFEGIFRQDAVVKGRNRDTAWFSMLDGEWPKIKSAFETWLSPDNFDADGNQRHSLFHIQEQEKS